MTPATASAPTADLDLERRVRMALDSSNMPTLRRLAVEARAGVVTLRGRVYSFYEKQISHSHCRQVAGVVGLVDAVDVVHNAR